MLGVTICAVWQRNCVQWLTLCRWAYRGAGVSIPMMDRAPTSCHNRCCRRWWTWSQHPMYLCLCSIGENYTTWTTERCLPVCVCVCKYTGSTWICTWSSVVAFHSFSVIMCMYFLIGINLHSRLDTQQMKKLPLCVKIWTLQCIRWVCSCCSALKEIPPKNGLCLRCYRVFKLLFSIKWKWMGRWLSSFKITIMQ